MTKLRDKDISQSQVAERVEQSNISNVNFCFVEMWKFNTNRRFHCRLRFLEGVLENEILIRQCCINYLNGGK